VDIINLFPDSVDILSSGYISPVTRVGLGFLYEPDRNATHISVPEPIEPEKNNYFELLL